MKRRGLILTVVLVALLGGCATRQSSRYLFVVPESLPDGTDSTLQRGRLEGWLVQRAGGFTEIDGVRGGWLAPDGAVVTEQNRLYLVTVPPGENSFEMELRGHIIEDFNQQEAWIERW